MNKISAAIYLLHSVFMVHGSPVQDVLLVDFECGTSLSDTSTVTVTADRDVRAIAVCKDGHTYQMVSDDTVHYRVTATYSGTSTDGCVFREISSSNAFDIDVLIGKQTNPGTSSVLQYGNRYTVTCKVASQGTKLSGTETIDDSKQAPIGVLQYKGSTMASSLVLETLDIRGTRLVGVVAVGKIVRLHATVTVSGAETGVKTLNCEATNGVTTYQVLIGGCGDGTVFPKTSGFETSGTDIHSPYFAAFRLQGSDQIVFHCIFTACTAPGGCDGDSCITETSSRRKRSVAIGTDEKQ